LVTIGSGVSEGAGVEFPTFPLTCVVVLKTLWHYRASVWFMNLFFTLQYYLLGIIFKFNCKSDFTMMKSVLTSA